MENRKWVCGMLRGENVRHLSKAMNRVSRLCSNAATIQVCVFVFRLTEFMVKSDLFVTSARDGNILLWDTRASPVHYSQNDIATYSPNLVFRDAHKSDDSFSRLRKKRRSSAQVTLSLFSLQNSFCSQILFPPWPAPFLFLRIPIWLFRQAPPTGELLCFWWNPDSYLYFQVFEALGCPCDKEGSCFAGFVVSNGDLEKTSW